MPLRYGPSVGLKRCSTPFEEERSGRTPSVEEVFKTFLIPDFAPWDPLWHSNLSADARGKEISDQFSDSDFGTLNDQSPTRIQAETISSPDITIAHPDFLPSTNWRTITALGSDHIPIIELQRHIIKSKATNRTYVNFAKANWEGFKLQLENLLHDIQLPTDVHKGERTFREKVIRAAKHPSRLHQRNPAQFPHRSGQSCRRKRCPQNHKPVRPYHQSDDRPN